MCVVLSACEAKIPAPLVANDIEITSPLPGKSMSAGYLTLTNNSSAEIELTEVFSEQFDTVEIHESTLQDGIARMRRLPELRIAAGSSVSLERGGKHLMMIGPTGNDKSVSLKFFSGDTLLLSVDAPLIARSQ